MKAWLLAARPKTLPAALVPVWVGLVLAWQSKGDLDGGLAAATLGGALAIQIATNFFNDALDALKGADTAHRLGPVRATASGALSPRQVMGGGSVFLLLAALCGVVLWQARGPVMLVIGLPSLFFAYGYTGGPFPLAYRGMGELFVILFFGLVAVGGTVFVQLGTWPPTALWQGLAVGGASAVLVAVNNLRDEEEDRRSGKKTLAVRWGTRVARLLISALVLLPVFVSLTATSMGGWVVLPVLAWLPALGLVWRAPRTRLNAALALTALGLLLYGLAVQLSVG